jgi:hypothetical protein
LRTILKESGKSFDEMSLWQIIGSGGRVLLMTYVPNVEFGYYYYLRWISVAH